MLESGKGHIVLVRLLILAFVPKTQPDIELLTEINFDLGKRHVRYGVTPAMYEFMGEALLYMLDKMIGENFTPDVREAWKVIYAELSSDIISAYSTP